MNQGTGQVSSSLSGSTVRYYCLNWAANQSLRFACSVTSMRGALSLVETLI